MWTRLQVMIGRALIKLPSSNTNVENMVDGGGGSSSSSVSAGNNVVATAQKVNEVLHNIVGPCLTALGGMAIIYIVVLGVQYAKSENADKRAEMKKRIVNLAIGVVIMIVMITMCFAIQWDKIIPELFGYLEE